MNKNNKMINDSLKRFFPNGDYTLSKLDSLYKKYKINDKTFKQRRDSDDKDIGAIIDYKIAEIERGNNYLKNLINEKHLDTLLKTNFNVSFNYRELIQASPKIWGFSSNFSHSTEVSSIIVAKRDNDIGLKGFHNNIKIMPLPIGLYGNEYDEDIANAIYYATNNGAKVINMSFGKDFSFNQAIVTKAIQYAESKNVLIVHSAGNDKLNIDIEYNSNYPNDFEYKHKIEFASNFVVVGCNTKENNEKLVSDFSNYGKNNVDIFALGSDLKVAMSRNRYKVDSGTSLSSAMVSGTAALIWLYYPNLTATEVKNIILKSGTKIEYKVLKPGTKELVNFSELCKSGKILNVFNAMALADKISKGRG